MRSITADPSLVAYCGLYCGACGSYLKERCPGCHGNVKAGWCKVRACNIERKYASCAECTDFADPRDCRKFNNFVSRIFGLVMRSDRPACIAQIRSLGLDGHAREMAALKRQSLPRGAR